MSPSQASETCASASSATSANEFIMRTSLEGVKKPKVARHPPNARTQMCPAIGTNLSPAIPVLNATRQSIVTETTIAPLVVGPSKAPVAVSEPIVT